MEERLTRSHTPISGAISSWYLLREGESVFFKGVTPHGSTKLQGGYHTQEIWAAQIGLHVLKKKNKRTQNWVGVDLGGDGNGGTMSKIYL